MTSLGEFVAGEVGVDVDQLMLLRHSTSTMKLLRSVGVSVKEYTEVQPKHKRYNYFLFPDKPIKVVVVIVEDKVDSVYRVQGIDAEGTNYSLNVPSITLLDKKLGRPKVDALRFRLRPLQSTAVGKRVTGWERRQRTPVQRSDEAFFSEIEINLPRDLPTDKDIRHRLEHAVEMSMHDSPAVRARRLKVARTVPVRIEVRSFMFERNPDVIAEVLHRARGRCELCRRTAPFLKRRDGTPYLEVHHKIRLADDGEDRIENAQALCPNCHRREHFG